MKTFNSWKPIPISRSRESDGVERMTKYLGELDEQHFQIVLDFGAQLIRTDPSVALVLFTNEGEAEKWPRAKVYDMFRQQCAPRQMRTSLLEHFIYEWSDTDPQVGVQQLTHTIISSIFAGYTLAHRRIS